MATCPLRSRWLTALAGLWLGLAAAGAEAALTPTERRGKELYLTGRSAEGGEITAVLEPAGTEVPAAALACASCHGFDGRGRPEGGAVPSDVTWIALTKPYGIRHASGREHPPYDERLVKRAITLGLDPAGNRLDAVMPRYRLTHDQAADLVAYLRRIADDRDPGVGEDSLHLGTLLPAEPEAGAAVRALLEAFVERLNRRGGLYGRSLRLSSIAPAGAPGERRRALVAYLDGDEPFALVAPHLSGAEEELAPLLGERGIPAVGAVAQAPRLAFPLNRYVFYLYPGVPGEAQALAIWLGRGAPDGARAAALFPQESGLARLAAESAERAALAVGLALQPLAYPGALLEVETLLDRAAASGAGSVIFLGADRDGPALLAGASARGLRWLAPGSLAAHGLLGAGAGARGQAILALPTQPGDITAAGSADYAELAASAGLPRHHRPAQWAALAAAKLLTEGLQRAGREVSRERLVVSLEGLYRYETGVSPLLTFGPNRRVGSGGAYVVKLDLATGRPLAEPEWVEVQ